MNKKILLILITIFIFINKVYALDNKLNISSINYENDYNIILSGNNLGDTKEIHNVGIGKELRLYVSTYGNCGDGINCLTVDKYLKVVNTSLSNVVWESSNPDVATVSGSGLVTGIKEGISTITATYDGLEATYTVIVNTYLGDVDKNSIVDKDDAKLIAKYIIDNNGIDEDDLLVANYNNDTDIKMNDVMKLISDVKDNWVNSINDKECTGIGSKETCTIDSDTLKVWVEKKSLKNKSYKCLDNYPYNCTDNCECVKGESIVTDRNFYVTHIWVKDPYNQIKTKLVDKEDENIFNVSELMHEGNNGELIETSGSYTKTTENKITYQVIPSKNLETIDDDYEYVVAINASAQSGAMLNPYLLMGDGEFYNIFKDDTSEATITGTKYVNTVDDTTNVRYYYDADSILDTSIEYVYSISEEGILSDNKFKYASVNDTDKSDYNENVRTYYDIIRNNPKYTFSFYPTLMRGGNSVLNESSLTNKNMRQVLCQVDKNNFIILTSEYAPGADDNRPFSVSAGGLTPVNVDDKNAYYYARIHGILSFADTINELRNLGCQTAVNLDGGGSIALLMRKDGQTNVISGDNRVTPDILYFHE